MAAHLKKSERVPFPLRILRLLGKLILIVLALAVALVIFLTVTEYRPDDTEPVTLSGTASSALHTDTPVTVMAWNIGYGALGDNTDYFMDGGEMVNTSTKERVQANLRGMSEVIREYNPDLLLLQETDISSKRSHHIDEADYFSKQLTGYEWGFANNFKVAFLPYPIPPIGKVNSGIVTYSKYPAAAAQRISLPVPFSWPVRIANLKRCLLETRIPVEGSDRELVLYNLHLEAYDSGEGKIAQTAALREILEKEVQKGNYVIAGGDFNQVFSTIDMSAYPEQEGKWLPGRIDVADYPQSWQFLMDAKTPTCRSLDQPYVGADYEHFQYYMIDGFICSENVSVQSLETVGLGFVYSDHNPVVMKFILN